MALSVPGIGAFPLKRSYASRVDSGIHIPAPSARTQLSALSSALQSRSLSPTARKAVEAYDGAERWQSARTIEANATLTGFLFWAKTRLPRPSMNVRCQVHRPWIRLKPIDRAGRTGSLEGRDVRLI